MLIVSAGCVLAEEQYPEEITFDGDKVKWGNNTMAELERLSEDSAGTKDFSSFSLVLFKIQFSKCGISQKRYAVFF